MKPLQLVLVGCFLIGFSFFANAETVEISIEDLEMNSLVEELINGESNSAENEKDCALGKEGSSKFELDLSAVLKEIETHSKNSCHNFLKTHPLEMRRFLLKKRAKMCL